MRDPIEKMRKFVEEQKQRARLEYARQAWAQKVPELLPAVEAVVEVMRGGLPPDQLRRANIAVLADPRRDLFPLIVAFDRRPYPDDRQPRLHAELAHGEVGASACFRCEADGLVYGYRYPFHSVLSSPEPELFAELGEPAMLQADEVANIVVEFLQWATTGTGCGSRPLRFWTPAVPVSDTAPMVRLAVLAA
jgi:hypothetical protein